MERRDVMGGGLAAGLAALVGAERPEAAAPAAPQRGDGNDEAVAGAVQGVTRALETLYSGPWQRITQIREQQRIWMRANHRFPDFIEIGIGIWDAVYDWHVRYQQPINMTRTTDGRYIITFMFTALVLRPDLPQDYVGPPFEAGRGPGQ